MRGDTSKGSAYHVSRRYQRRLIRLALLLLLVCTGLLSAHASASQSSCPTQHCIYVPLITIPLPVRIVTTQQLFDDCKGTCYSLTGVLEPTTAQPVYDVTLEARFTDAAGQPIRTAIITPTLVATLPHQHNRFSFSTSNVGFKPANYELAIRSWTTTSARVYQPLTIVAQEAAAGIELGYVRGVIRNDQPQALHDIVVLAELDGIGSMYGVDQIVFLAPGATASFRVDFVYPAYTPPPEPVVQAQGSFIP